MKFVIDRSKWLRGEGNHKSYLLRESDRKQCCIGQICSQVGIDDSSIIGAHDLSGGEKFCINQSLENGDSFSASWVFDAYGINDNVCYDDADRERLLQDLFARHGHELEFVDSK